MSTSVCNNTKYLDFTKRIKYFKDISDRKTIPLKIKEKDPEFYRKYERALRVCFNHSTHNIERVKPEVLWIYGNVGSGKTEWAGNYLKDYDSLILKSRLYRGLEGKPYLLYDNINPKIQDFVTLLHMLHGFKCLLNTIGGSYNVLYEKICITSYLNPLEFVRKYRGEQPHALFWRIDRIIHCTHDKTTNTFNTEEMKEEDFYDPAEESERCTQSSNNTNKRFKYE
jgi:hypothetical protein